MRELLIIIEREFKERVKTRAFLIGTLLFPVFLMAVFLMPAVGADSTAHRSIVVVDRAPAGVADVFVAALVAGGLDPAGDDALAGAPTTPGDATAQAPYSVEVVGADTDVEALNDRVLNEDVDGYVVLPADLLENGEVLYRALTITNRFVLRDLRVAATAAIQSFRLDAAGVDARTLSRLLAPVEVRTARITETGEEGGDAESTFFVAYILAFMAYFIIAMYGHSVMRSVIQEKVTRISEILVSTVRASHLMAGKVAGVSAAALLQVAIWAGLVVLLVSQSDMLQQRFGVPASAVDAIRIDPLTGATLLLFFVLGFLLYAALFAALGAAMSTEQEAQPFQMVLMLPLFVPLLFLGPITNDPDGTISLVLGLLPLTAPVAMPMRLAAASAGAPLIAASLGLLVLATAAFAWVAGKIYRVGILAAGKRPSPAELIRWIRAA